MIESALRDIEKTPPHLLVRGLNDLLAFLHALRLGPVGSATGIGNHKIYAPPCGGDLLREPVAPRALLVGTRFGAAHDEDSIARADLVVYDQLVPKRLLDGARADAEKLCVRDLPGLHPDKYPHIYAKLIEAAKAGKVVVRLKGGDPLIFGRGGEELETLVGSGIGFQVVPGITAASGCAPPIPPSPAVSSQRPDKSPP